MWGWGCWAWRGQGSEERAAGGARATHVCNLLLEVVNTRLRAAAEAQLRCENRCPGAHTQGPAHQRQRQLQHVVQALHPAVELVVVEQRVGDAHEGAGPEHLEHQLDIVRRRQANGGAGRRVAQHGVQDGQQRREGGVDDLGQGTALVLEAVGG